MDGQMIDAIKGKYYDLETLENDLVKVESAGPCIRVGIKNKGGEVFSWWEPRHPFLAPPPGSLPKQGEWDFAVEVLSTDEVRATFIRGEEQHVLILVVTSPISEPKPVDVSWE